MTQLKSVSALAALVLVAATSSVALAQNGPKIMLDSSGGFVTGGKIQINPNNPDRSLSCDHGYVEYFLPQNPRKTSLVMWHSSSTQVWQNRWDGGEGFKDKMLRADYPTYIWDGPRVGRANWSCESITYTPISTGIRAISPPGNLAPRFSPDKCRRRRNCARARSSRPTVRKLEEYWWNATGAPL